MLAFDPFAGEMREFVLCAGGVFQVGSRPFLVTGPSDDGLLSVVDEHGRSRSVDGCELHVVEGRVVPVMMRRLGVRLCRS